MGLFSRLYPEPRHPLYRKVQKLLSKGCQEQLLRKNAPSKIFYIIRGWRLFGASYWEGLLRRSSQISAQQILYKKPQGNRKMQFWASFSTPT